MSGFLIPPAFAGPFYGIPTNLPIGYVLTLTAAGPRFQPAGGGGGGGVGAFLANAPTAGVKNNFNPAGFGTTIGRLDINTAAGDVELTGLLAGTDAQLLILANTGANNLILDPQNVGSTAANRFRLPAQMFVVPNDALLLCYYAGGLNRWCKGG